MELTRIDKLMIDADDIDTSDAIRALRKTPQVDDKAMLCQFSIANDMYLQAKPTKSIFRANSMHQEFGRLFKSKPQLAEPWVHAAFISFKTFNKDNCRAAVVFYVWDTREVLHVEDMQFAHYMKGDALAYTAHIQGWQRAADNGAPVLTYSEQLKLLDK